MFFFKFDIHCTTQAIASSHQCYHSAHTFCRCAGNEIGLVELINIFLLPKAQSVFPLFACFSLYFPFVGSFSLSLSHFLALFPLSLFSFLFFCFSQYPSIFLKQTQCILYAFCWKLSHILSFSLFFSLISLFTYKRNLFPASQSQ